MFQPPPARVMKKSSSLLYSVYIELRFVLNASRSGLPLLCLRNGPLTDIYQTSAFITRSDADVSLHNSDHFAPSSDMVLEHGDSEPFEGPDDPPLDSDESTFMDLFTESESSLDTANTVCKCLIPASHLIRDLGCSTCYLHICFSCSSQNALDNAARDASAN